MTQGASKRGGRFRRSQLAMAAVFAGLAGTAPAQAPAPAPLQPRRPASASAQAAHCAKVYKELLETGMITAGGANPGDPEGAG